MKEKTWLKQNNASLVVAHYINLNSAFSTFFGLGDYIKYK